MSWQNYVIKNTNIEGARASFETDCATLFRTIYPENDVRRVEVRRGDGGIDIFIGNIGIEPIILIQCKFFLNEFGTAQHQQISKSFKTAVESSEYKFKEWILCIPGVLDLKQNLWWSKWVNDQLVQNNLKKGSIILKDGEALIDLFKKHDLYDQVFKVEELIYLQNIDEKIDIILKGNELTYELAKFEVKKASFYLENVSNFFGDNTTTHIDRKETVQIYDWIKRDLHVNEKNVFIVEAEKGYGKTVILKDLLSKLNEEKIDSLGIKADKYYASSRQELEEIIFQKQNIHVEDIARTYNKNGKLLVIIVDQLDALSQSLSSNREYLQTYNRLIADLSYFNNVRIIVSTRSFDLNYDAEISLYKKTEYTKLKIELISEESIKEVLAKYKIHNASKKLLELLSIPNHLDIFCRIPDKKDRDTLTSLKDLFDVLWDQLIGSQKELNLKDILYKISNKMYEQQQIITLNLFDNSQKELNYLKSNTLIVESDKELQFFHQTFYDYTFSRQFVESKKSLENYIKKNSQSLYVRSVTKMVVEYYREYDHKEYIRLLRKLIGSSYYRFHLKTLVISSLAAMKKPTEDEKYVAAKYVLPDFSYTQLFITEVKSSGWFNFLIEKDIPLIYFQYSKKWYHVVYEKLVKKKIIKNDFFFDYNFEKQKSERITLNLRLFDNNSKENIETILNYLPRVHDFDGKTNFMENFLFDLDVWSTPKLLPLFDIYLAPNETDKNKDVFWFYHTLEKIITLDCDFVFNKIKKIILRDFIEGGMFADFSHDQTTLFEKINEIYPDKAFKFFFEIYNLVVEENRYEDKYEKAGSILYDSYVFSSDIEDSDSDNAEFFIQKKLSDYIMSNAKSKSFFISFFNAYKDSNSISILKILILGLIEYPGLYKTEILDFIKIIYVKNGFNTADDKFQFYLRTLIGKCISMYNDKEKAELVEIIMSVKDPTEIYSLPRKESRNKFGSCYGKKKYLFLDLLPEEERNGIPIIKKTYLELQRRFPDFKIKPFRNRRVTWSSVGAPLPAKAYAKMDMKNWKETIIKYGDTYTREINALTSKGEKSEHARALEDAVCSDPDKFYPFLFELLKDSSISPDYLASGINGLIKAKFDASLVLPLFHEHTKRHLNSFNSLCAVRNIDYFIDHKIVDKELITFLTNLLLNSSDSDKIVRSKDPLTESLNTMRGAAAHRIIKCSYNYMFQEDIFRVLEQIAEDKDDAVKAGILYNLAYLNNFDLERSFRIFLRITDTDNFELIKNSFKSAAYFRNAYYEEMKPLFRKIIENEELHKNGGVLIALNWISGLDKEKIFYNSFVSKSVTANLELLRTAEANIIKDGEMDAKCMDIFFQFLNCNKDFANVYSGFVLRKFTVANFKMFFPFMKKYARSEVFRSEPRYFLKYLMQCSKDFPVECLELVRVMSFKKGPNFKNRGQYDSEPVQLILSIYSSLNNNFKSNKKEIQVSLKIFDNMMRLDHLRYSANSALDKL
ncbi:NACHT domain-containing protein [Flavobacterium mesophilum]|uniref:NACHT domain-containing protein n=1 Tax=Flavobacterium mesophilum TaxID=3143495 RepID=UPI0031DB493C